MKRGEIWWADLPLPMGRRPVVLLSRDEAYNVRTDITAAGVTATIRNLPSEVILTKEEGLYKASVVSFDSIYTFRKELLKKRICTLKPEKIARINRAICFALAL